LSGKERTRNARHTYLVGTIVPTPLTAIAGAAILAAGGFGIGSAVVGSGGTSKAPAARTPALAADPTGRPAHSRYVYNAPGTVQSAVPNLPPVGGQAPAGGPVPNGGAGYVPHGQIEAPLGALPKPVASPVASTWPLYLSGGDLLQPDKGAAVGTNQTVGPNMGGACGSGLAGHWTAPVTADFPFHGTWPGLLHVVASGSAPLTISVTRSVYGGGCQVLATTTAVATGTQSVSFTLPRVDVTIPKGENLSFVVDTPGSAKILSSSAAPSYIVAPTSPQ
jgi:hypothetical protein